jgi:hypothetical protein
MYFGKGCANREFATFDDDHDYLNEYFWLNPEKENPVQVPETWNTAPDFVGLPPGSVVQPGLPKPCPSITGRWSFRSVNSRLLQIYPE